MKVPVEWLELRNEKIVAKIKQKKGGDMPMTIDEDKLREQFPFLKHVESPAALIGLIKRKGGTIDMPNLKMGENKRERRLERRKEEARWSK